MFYIFVVFTLSFITVSIQFLKLELSQADFVSGLFTDFKDLRKINYYNYY